MIRFTTESGSVYETKRRYSLEGDGDHIDYIRRVNPDAAKRADGEWVRLYGHYPNPLQVGSPAFLQMEGLSKYGPDDEGTHGSPLGTQRTTTVVTSVADAEEER